MKPSNPEDLEKWVHQTLQSLPDRQAPRSLESSVWGAIEARQALPWWRQSFAHWPVAIRAVFLIFTGTLAVSLMALFLNVGPVFDSVASRPEAQMFTALINNLGAKIHAGWDWLTGSIPLNWVYTAAALVGLLYVDLIGLGATAYRLLFFQR